MIATSRTKSILRNALLTLVSGATAVSLLLPNTAAAQLANPTLVPSTNSSYELGPSYIRAGVPILFTGRMLPLDATGTLTFYVDGQPVQTSTLATQTFADYVALGDSITASAYLGNPAQRYQAIVAANLNLNLSFYAAPGMSSCDVMEESVVPNGLGLQTTSAPLYSVLVGSNDLDLFGIGSGEQYFKGCHQAILSWLGTPTASKILIGDPAVNVQSGIWIPTPVAGSCCVNTLENIAGIGTVRFTMTTTGNAAYLWYQTQIVNPGSFTVSVDGGAPTSPISTFFPPNSSSFGIPGSYALLRLPVAAGTHTFDITAQGGSVGLLGMGSMPATSKKTTILVSDVPNQASVNDAAAAIAEYTADIQADIALLSQDGFDLRFVPTQQYMFATPAEMVDSKHPNQLGMTELAAAFSAAITPSSPVADTITLPAASYLTSSIPVGGHGVGIVYSGDSHYASTGETSTLVVYDPTSSVSLTSDAATYSAQSPITLTAYVPSANANGQVAFFDVSGATPVQLGSAWIVGGPNTATLTLPSLNPGQHALMVQYAGDNHYNGSSSVNIVITVSGTYTATSLTSAATRYDSGAPVVLTADVSPATATGNITFLDGTTVLAQAPLAGGSASFSTSSLTPGIHLITASYGGTATLDASVSPVFSVEIDLNPTVTAITPPPASISFGSALTLNASVSPATATGTVTFSDGSKSIGQATLAGGVATVNIPTLAIGGHSFTATYSGDTTNLPSVSASVSTTVVLASSTTALAPVPASTTFGTAVALSASVTPAAATGTVTFTDSISGTLAQIPLVNGSAGFSATSLAPGIHAISASYSGDSSHAASTSAALSSTVNQIAASIALSAPAATLYLGNALSLSAAISPASASGTVTFRDATLGVLGQSTIAHGAATLTLSSPAAGTYSITAAYSGDTNDTAATSNTVATQILSNATSLALATSSAVAPADAPVTLSATLLSPSAGGSVSFFDGSSTLGIMPVANGKAAFTTSNLLPGPHTLHATYSGDSAHAASTSAAVTQTITDDSTTTTLTLAQSSVVAGSTITFNVRIADSYATPAGTISVRSGATTLASGAVANASAGAGFATLSINSSTLGLGTFPVTAFYSGDAFDQPSDSSAIALSVTITAVPTTAALTLSSAQIPILGVATVSATVAATGAIPTGSIAFLSNGTALATAPLNAAGTASYNLAAGAIGSDTITAVYSPTGLFAGTSIAPATLIVTAPLSASLSPTSISADAGTSVSATLTLTPLSGFTGAIQTTCATTIGFVTCSLSAPASITGPTTVPVQIAVSRTDLALATPAHPLAFAAAFAVMLPLIRLRRSKRALSVLGVLLASLYFSGCASSGNFSSVPAGPQTVAITITAAGLVDTTSITVNVQQ